jgi:radical SAM superfamily enzyme YgiQ (UPF0313 family)
MKLALYKTILQPYYQGTYYLGFALIKAFLARYRPDIETIVCHSPEQVLTELPDVIGLSSVTETWEATKFLARQFKEITGVPIIIGGQHVSALPETLPIWVDVGVVGEGEETILELLNNLDGSVFRGMPSIKGIVFWQNGQLNLTPNRQLIDMDTLPEPADPPSDRYRLSTVRGCPFACTHCVEYNFHAKVRQLSAHRLFELIIAEHERSGQTEFEFLDDLFFAFPKRIFQLRDLLRQRGLLRRFHFWKVSAVAHLLNDEIMLAAKDIGVVDMGMGMESASPRVLGWFKGRHGTLQHLKNAITLAERHQVPLGAAPVFGYPGETLHDVELTMDFYKKAEARGLNRYGMWICQPLPGSILWQRGLESGELSIAMDFSTLRIGGNESPFITPYYYSNNSTVPQQAFEAFIAAHGFWAVPGTILRPTPNALSPLLLHAVTAGHSLEGIYPCGKEYSV